MRTLLVAVFGIGCLNPAMQPCGELLCSTTTVCAPTGDRCVTQSQLDACSGKASGDSCTLTATIIGVCDRAVCITSGCGNGIVEVTSDEVCDDGNATSLDGCSADCKSSEVCGDGVADPAVGENCDCGSDAADLPFGCNDVNSLATSATCRPDCTLGRCGDGVLDAHEVCDDGNTAPGDGCRADCAGRWTPMQSGTLANLRGIWAASPTDAWAVGGNRIMRWNGTTWYSQPPIDSMIDSYIAVYGTAQDVFVIGGFTNRVLRFNAIANAWTDVTPGGVIWNAIYGRGNDIRIVGGDIGAPSYARAAHWDGNAFIVESGSTSLPNAFVGVWLSPGGTVYVTDQTVPGYVYKRGPADLQWMSMATSGTYITGSSDTDVSVFSQQVAPSHYDGAAWAPLVHGDELSTTAASAVPGQAIAVGRHGGVLLCDGLECIPSQTGVSSDLWGVWALSATEAFIIGDQGTILY